MNDGADIAVDTPVQPATPRRARVLGVLSIVLGACSFAVLPTPLPSAFPWLTLLLSLSGATLAVMALRQRRRGRLATVLAWLGLLASLAFPILVVFVFVRYLNVNS
jgi:hypothetical protein